MPWAFIISYAIVPGGSSSKERTPLFCQACGAPSEQRRCSYCGTSGLAQSMPLAPRRRDESSTTLLATSIPMSAASYEAPSPSPAPSFDSGGGGDFGGGGASGDF